MNATAKDTSKKKTRAIKLTVPQCLCLVAGADIDLDLMLAQQLFSISEDDIQEYLSDYCASDTRPVSSAVLYAWIKKYHVEITDV